MSSRIPAITLHNGGKMPMVGLGTYKSRDDEIRQALNVALECGYRHIDTATVYENEVEIGDVLHEWLSSGRIAREELFVVTKLPMTGNRYKDVGRFLQDSLDKLRLSYVDLYLIHSPVGMKEHSKGEFDLDTNHEEIYKAMEEQVSYTENCKVMRFIVVLLGVSSLVEIHASSHSYRPLDVGVERLLHPKLSVTTPFAQALLAELPILALPSLLRRYFPLTPVPVCERAFHPVPQGCGRPERRLLDRAYSPRQFDDRRLRGLLDCSGRDVPPLCCESRLGESPLLIAQHLQTSTICGSS
nr:alcohol dehydrogenase [NADP(+)]-like [Penaeus vannamei]